MAKEATSDLPALLASEALPEIAPVPENCLPSAHYVGHASLVVGSFMMFPFLTLVPVLPKSEEPALPVLLVLPLLPSLSALPKLPALPMPPKLPALPWPSARTPDPPEPA